LGYNQSTPAADTYSREVQSSYTALGEQLEAPIHQNSYTTHLGAEGVGHPEETATKADDAEIPVVLWDARVWSGRDCQSGKCLVFRQHFNDSSFLRKFDLLEPYPLAVLQHAVFSK
jgi:hypothetical protein